MTNLTDFFKIASDETRLRIVILLAQGDLYVCQISGILNLSQPKISKKLAKLRDMNFVNVERKEKYILYSLKIEDNVIRNLISNIIENIDNYPVLRDDRQRLIDKQIYLNKCKQKPEK